MNTPTLAPPRLSTVGLISPSNIDIGLIYPSIPYRREPSALLIYFFYKETGYIRD